ncbi:30S ribosomal protein S4 [Thermoleophilia bacterium SCSIO 60948]|nr:30S ribosomal protein S4 [Thermoleophilia bacterium SCSIO 60948]
MGRYTGPKEKLSRREGVQLGLKGERLLNGKSAMERRPYPPGEHGRGRRRDSEYSLRLRAKQRAKRMYGLRERQFSTLFDRANRESGQAGENLLRRLELRLDNVVFRLGLANTRAQARQFVVHRHVLVNGARVDRPSYALSAGDVVQIKPGAKVEGSARAATELAGATPAWLLADPERLSGSVVREPAREDFSEPIDDRLIVEHYSR